MVTKDDLKGIYLLDRLTDEMLELIPPIATLHQFEEGDVIYEEGDPANDFLMLKRGKILLQVELAEMIIISLGSIKTGYSFGWSALLPGSTYTSYAICSEPCEVISLPGRGFLKILNDDHTMGYRVMDATMRVLKNRLERRTGQFLKVMSKHPDIQKLLGL